MPESMRDFIQLVERKELFSVDKILSKALTANYVLSVSVVFSNFFGSEEHG